jgi:hypothetical protein
MKKLTMLRNKTFNVGEDRDMDLNACVGNNGHVGKRGYGAGFAEGAKLLLAELVKDGTEATVDTLIYPICFSARHSIELFMKEQIERMGRLRSTVPVAATATTHDLSNLWEEFARVAVATDRRFAEFVPRLADYIGDFAEIDPTGQTFRYPDDNESKRHLVATSIINVVLFKKRFEELAALIEDFEILSDLVREEYRCGTYTDKLSRADLSDIARTMPQRNNWDSEAFTKAKAEIVHKYGLSSREFCKALDIIQKHCQFSSYLGVEIPIPGLTVASLDRIGLIASGEMPRREMDTASMIALDAVFQVGRPSQYCEDYLAIAADSADDPDVLGRAGFLFSNWEKKIDRLRVGLLKLGQVSLAERLNERHPPSASVAALLNPEGRCEDE